jgi:sugar lactone lactonase YvrE
MRSRSVEVALDAQADLGEGPWWDQEGGELLWVDVFAGRIHRFNPLSGQNDSFAVGQPVGMVARRRSGGLVCAVRDGIGFVDIDGGRFSIVKEIEALVDNRMNDGACDPAGRLWAGTMATDLSPSAGTLYRISPELEVTAMRTGVSISNGLDWSPDGRTFYFTDSTTRCVDVYDFDVETGDISNRRLLIQLPDPIATPDGMAVDAHGTLWIAMWDGGCVRRFDPQGGLLETIELPVSRPTSVAFGGENLDRLFVTSARNGLSASQLAEESHPGAIFVIEPGVTGRLPHAFDG